MKEKPKDIWGILILAIFYLVGLIGIKFSIHPDFVLLTPFHLLLSMACIIFFHEKRDQNLLGFVILSCICGFLVEVIGVKTGVIFGEYSYGSTLGLKILNTPLVIGINWFMLVYAAGTSIEKYLPKIDIILKCVVGASILTVLDILIEPVAIKYDFWTWGAESIPLQNYIAWWIISLILLFVYFKILPKNKNIVAESLLILQFLFFGILSL